MGESKHWKFPLRAAFALWVLCIAIGFGGLWAYSTRPGVSGNPPPSWPEEIARRGDRSTLVLFCHPRCPCTLASVAELQRLAVECGSDLEIICYLVLPPGVPSSWERGALADQLEGFQEAELRLDPEGRVAERFRIATSGDVCLYDSEGRLAFSGGITPSRAHEGESHGRTAIRGIVARGEADIRTSPVYGCPLLGPMGTSGPATAEEGGCCER